MAITQLKSQQIQPDLTKISALSTQVDTNRLVSDKSLHLFKWQPRIASALSLLCPHTRANYSPRFMLLKAPESELLFSLLEQAVKSNLSSSELGYSYFFNENKITLSILKSFLVASDNLKMVKLNYKQV